MSARVRSHRVTPMLSARTRSVHLNANAIADIGATAKLARTTTNVPSITEDVTRMLLVPTFPVRIIVLATTDSPEMERHVPTITNATTLLPVATMKSAKTRRAPSPALAKLDMLKKMANVLM